MLWKTLKKQMNVAYDCGKWPLVYVTQQTENVYPIRYKCCKEISKIRLWKSAVCNPNTSSIPEEEEVFLTELEAITIARMRNGILYYVMKKEISGKELYIPMYDGDYDISLDDGETFYESFEDAYKQAYEKNGIFK